MRNTTTVTSKGQVTIPKVARDKLGLRTGTKMDIYPLDDSFMINIHRPSRILDFVGDLRALDRGESLRDIREGAQRACGVELARRLESLATSEST